MTTSAQWMIEQIIDECKTAQRRKYALIAKDAIIASGVHEYYPERSSRALWAQAEVWMYAHDGTPITMIHAPKPTTPRNLLILLHECGHIALGHVLRRELDTDEYDASQWALQRMPQG